MSREYRFFIDDIELTQEEYKEQKGENCSSVMFGNAIFTYTPEEVSKSWYKTKEEEVISKLNKGFAKTILADSPTKISEKEKLTKKFGGLFKEAFDTKYSKVLNSLDDALGNSAKKEIKTEEKMSHRLTEEEIERQDIQRGFINLSLQEKILNKKKYKGIEDVIRVMTGNIDKKDKFSESIKNSYMDKESQTHRERYKKLFELADKIADVPTNPSRNTTIYRVMEDYSVTEETVNTSNVGVKNNKGKLPLDIMITKQFPKALEADGTKETENKLDYELDWKFIQQLAERMASNKGKYEPYNWMKPIDIEKLKQSLFRHVMEVMKGNYEDDNKNNGHILAIAINAMMLNFQLEQNA